MEDVEADEGAPLTISNAEDGGGIVISLEGELDLSSAPQLREAIDEALESKPDHLVLDLHGLRFMDSSGIAVLVHTQARIDSLTLRQPAELIRRVLEITGLTKVFAVEQ
ncbi:MAG: STAS domain-containing protein [Acidimicrobiales bacterium]